MSQDAAINALIKHLERKNIKAAKCLSAGKMIDNDNALFNLAYKLDRLKNDPEIKAKLAIKLGIPLAGVAGLLIGGSKINRDAEDTYTEHASTQPTYF